MSHQSDCSLLDFLVVNQAFDLFRDTIIIISLLPKYNEKS